MVSIFTKAKGLTIPELSINAITTEKLVVRAHFRHNTILQHQNLVAIADRAETMSHKHTGAALVLENTVDVLEEGLLSICIEGGCLEIVS